MLRHEHCGERTYGTPTPDAETRARPGEAVLAHWAEAEVSSAGAHRLLI